MPLFRAEALDHLGQRRLGTILVRSSAYEWILAAVALFAATSLLALFLKGEYTRRATVSGYLLPEAGLVRLQAPMPGRLQTLWVEEGMLVEAGARLASIIDERIGSNGADARAAVSAQFAIQKAKLTRSALEQRELYEKTRQGFLKRKQALTLELAQAASEYEAQRTRHAYAVKTLHRYENLAAQGFVSPLALQERQEGVAEQLGRLLALERNRTALGRDLEAVVDDLEALPLRERSQMADLDRAMAEVERLDIESRSRSQVILTAPVRGRISALALRPGDVITPDKTLLVLVPEGSTLEAHLFAPSKDIGFIRMGQEVALRLRAYPFQKFGHAKGRVQEISQAPLAANDLALPLPAKSALPSGLSALIGPSPGSASDPVYRIKIRMDRQFVQAEGKQQPLQSGMQLEADIFLDRRTLLEWVFEPLYSLRGRYLP